MILLFPSFTIVRPSLHLHISIFLELEKYENQLLYTVIKDISFTKTLVNYLVLSRIDYCSSLLINLPLSSISPLNRVIRPSIRTNYNLHIRDHSSTSLYQHFLLWFSFNKRSSYRILSIFHSSIYCSNCPSYISASLVQRSSLLSLRNNSYHFLSTPILRPSKIKTRALSYIGPKILNSRPPYIRSIKSHKTLKKCIQQLISGGNL